VALYIVGIGIATLTYQAFKKDVFLCFILSREKMAEEGQVIACHTVDTWKEHFEKGKGSQKLVFASLFEPFSICVC